MCSSQGYSFRIQPKNIPGDSIKVVFPDLCKIINRSIGGDGVCIIVSITGGPSV